MVSNKVVQVNTDFDYICDCIFLSLIIYRRVIAYLQRGVNNNDYSAVIMLDIRPSREVLMHVLPRTAMQA